MPSNRNKLVTLTDYKTGIVFQVSSVDIISFTAIGVTDTTITYIGNRNKLKTRRVNETVAAINTACISNLINMMIPVTLDTGIILYLNIDRVIYVDSLSNSGPLVTAVTYDAHVNSPVIYKCSLPTPANFNSVTDTTFNINTVATGSIPSRVRYINNIKIASVNIRGTGASIFYDEHKTEFIKIDVTQTPLQLATAVALL